MSNVLQMYKNLPRNIYIMFFVKFINALGQFVVPFLSLFLTLKLGYSTVFASSIITLSVLTCIPGSMFGGILADKWDKKSTYILTQSSAALCILLCGFLTNTKILLFFLLLSTFFSSAVRPVLNAFVYDMVEVKDQKAAYSLLYLALNVGVSVGPLIAGFLFKHYLTLLFVGDALTSFIAVFLVAFFVKVKDQKSHHLIKEYGSGFLNFSKNLLHNPQLGIFFIIYLFLSFIYGQHSFSLPLMLKDVYSDKSSVYFGYLMSVNAITCVSATTFITYFTRNKSMLFSISLAGLFMGLGFGILGLNTNYKIYVLSTILWTIGEILLSTNVSIYIVQHCAITMQTRASAFQNIVNAAGNSLGTLTMGFVITHLGIHMVWPIIFVLGIISFVSMRIFERVAIIKKETMHT